MSSDLPDLPSGQFGEFSNEVPGLPATLEEAHARLLDCQDQNVHLRRELAGQKELMRDMSRLALTDPVTELGNRQAFDIDLPRVVDRAVRAGDPTSVALLAADIDGMKKVNDTLGHPIGDILLRAVGDTIRTVARPTDRGYRWGGDEFFVVKADFRPKGELQDTINRTIGRYNLTVQQKIQRAGIPTELDAGASFALDVLRHGEHPDAFVARVDSQLRSLKDQRRQVRRERSGGIEEDDRLY